jgi:DNA-binding SARP family transcriptional activator
MVIEYRVLGPLAAVIDGVEARLGGPRQRAVLAALLLRAGQVVPTSRIIDDVWGDHAPDSAGNLVQGYVSGLRKELGRHSIETREPGYVLRIGQHLLDLRRFEQLANDGNAALGQGDARAASERLAEALALWRGAALSDLPEDSPLRWQAAHLDELRQIAAERLAEAQIALGHAADSIAALRSMVGENPTSERPLALLMTALYQSGRQVEALEAYRVGRAALVDQLGLEPGEALQRLQHAILSHDPSLLPDEGPGSADGEHSTSRTILVAALDTVSLEESLAVARSLTSSPETGAWEVVVALTTSDAEQLTSMSEVLARARRSWTDVQTPLRTATFTSVTPGRDLARLATEQDACLVVVSAPERVLEDDRLARLLEQASSDVAVLVDGSAGDGPVVVPFSGGAHDWAAIELAALFARARQVPLRLLGATGPGGQDASRLLASASLAVQRALNVIAEPRLTDPGVGAILDAARGASMVVVGLSDRWTRDGLGPARSALAAAHDYPTLLVRRGTRPGALTPPDSHTRFTWTAQ